MNLTSCPLYGISRKRDLLFLLKIRDLKKIEKNLNSYRPYIANKTKSRLIEPISYDELKKCQKRIQVLLKDIEFDENIFSGISKKSYIDNGVYHIGCKQVVALDISKFFPNISREKVYNFFKNEMRNSSDVAKILTDICTINLESVEDLDKSVIEYIKENKIRYKNHVPTGSSISCILSYLANLKMFNEIVDLCKKYNCKVTIYVDDIVVSSEKEINKQLIDKIISIIRRNGYRIQKKKLKYYKNMEFKRVTGNVISKDGSSLVIPNKINYRILKLKKNKTISEEERNNKMRGYNNILKQIESKNIQYN